MIIRLATKEDFAELYKLYNDIIDYQSSDLPGARWTKDIYPSKNDINSHIDNSEFYVGIIDQKIACAGVLTNTDDDIYAKVHWTIADKANVCSLHLIAVGVNYRKQGLSKLLVNELIKIASKKYKAIHLDVLDGNERAKKLYESIGFKYVETLPVYYEDIGHSKAHCYEYIF